MKDTRPIDELTVSYHNIIRSIYDEDVTREGLLGTPVRAGEAFRFLTSGYTTDIDLELNGAIFDAEGADQLILVKNIEFYSLCEHHLLPFFGKVHVGYIPNGKLIGLSKVSRLVNVFARRLQIQERLTMNIADELNSRLSPEGVGVIIESVHLCQSMRGVMKQDAVMRTNAFTGCLLAEDSARSEFIESIKT